MNNYRIQLVVNDDIAKQGKKVAEALAKWIDRNPGGDLTWQKARPLSLDGTAPAQAWGVETWAPEAKVDIVMPLFAALRNGQTCNNILTAAQNQYPGLYDNVQSALSEYGVTGTEFCTALLDVAGVHPTWAGYVFYVNRVGLAESGQLAETTRATVAGQIGMVWSWAQTLADLGLQQMFPTEP